MKADQLITISVIELGRAIYWVENLQLSSSFSIKSTHEFKWSTKTLWHNGMKMLE